MLFFQCVRSTPAVIAGASLAILVACSPEPEVASGPAEPPETTAVLGPAQLTFGETGAGEIGADTPLEPDRIQSLFPQSVVRGVRAAPGAALERITVRRDDGLALDLHPGRDPSLVGRIVGMGGPIIGARGEALGAAWTDLAFPAENCLRGADSAVGQVICHWPGQPQLGYVFDIPGAVEDLTEGAEGAGPLAPAEKARLSAFVWTAAVA